MRWLVCCSVLAVACERAEAEQAPVGSTSIAPSAVAAAVPSAQSDAGADAGVRGTDTPPGVVELDPLPHPLAELSDAELAKLIDADPKQLGAASIGEPNRGQLWGGVQAESNELWEVVDPDRSWATPAVLAGLTRAVQTVHEEFPRTPRLHLGDLSRKRGGYLGPHRSHQSGLDADVSYYYVTEQKWYQKATKQNLDRPRTWALVRALTADPSVEYLFVDITVQRLLRAHAEASGELGESLDALFGGLKRRTEAPIRHTWGHRTHLHVRFRDPVAQETARRLYPLLRARRLVR
jgi:murein endopeptidase